MTKSKENSQMFQQIPKTLLLIRFWSISPIFGTTWFAQNIGFVTHNFTAVSNLMPKFRKNNDLIPKRGQIDARTDLIYSEWKTLFIVNNNNEVREFHKLTEATITYELFLKKKLAQNDFSTFFSSAKRKPCACLTFLIIFSTLAAFLWLQKNWSFPLRILLVNVTKSAGN